MEISVEDTPDNFCLRSFSSPVFSVEEQGVFSYEIPSTSSSGLEEYV